MKEKKAKKSIKTTKADKFKIIRFIILAIVIIVIVIISIKLFDIVNSLSNETYREMFKQKISDMGFVGVLAVIALQIIQIFIAVIPGQPVEIIIGMLYGTYFGVLICTIGIFLGTVIVYYTVKKIGSDFLELFFKPKEIEKTKSMKVFSNPAKLEVFLFIVFLLPAIPKDLFIFLGPATKIKPKRFLFIATLPRIPGLFLTVHAGNKITDGSYFMFIIVAIIVVIFWIGWFYINNKMEKDNK